MHIRHWLKKRRTVALTSIAIATTAAGALFVFVSNSSKVADVEQAEEALAPSAEQKPAYNSEVIQLSRDEELTSSSVVALVDGEAIRASEILAAYAKSISLTEDTIPPSVMRGEKLKLVKRDVQRHVDQKLLVAELRRMLTPEELDEIDRQLEEHFAQSTKKFGADTASQLEQTLQNKFGLSLSTWRARFLNEAMASACLHKNISAAGENLTADEQRTLSESIVADLRDKAEIKTIFQDEQL